MATYTNNGTTDNPTFTTATPLYNALADKVYDWANRDITALPAQIVRDSLRYAADTAYRTLRVPPLENTLVWTDFPRIVTITVTSTGALVSTITVNTQAEQDAAVEGILDTQTAEVSDGPLTASTAGTSSIYQSVTSLSIPPDLVEFIQIRGTDVDGISTRVFNEKADVRTFQDIGADIYSNAGFWTRMGNNVLISPSFANAARGFYGGTAGPESRIEMYYYRRLPALDAQYDQTFINWMLGLGTFSSGDTYQSAGTEADNQEIFDRQPANTWTGTEVPHWLRDQNEKAVLMGALGEVFAYLQEDDQAGKYIQLFQKEITELNDEDKMRDASGGNIQVHFNGLGLI